jgi:hypothetical protein
MSPNLSIVMLLCTVAISIWLFAIVHAIHDQTAALTRIAVASEAMAKQTEPPISIEVSGFSEEAQKVFNDALKPGTKKKGNGK